jgi:tetratricopeptide (TPR) repeat protein
MYVTAPDDTSSAWYITAFRCIERTLDEPLNAARDYCLDMQYAQTNATTIRSISAVASDFNGVVRGVWHPVAQTTNSITLSYVTTLSNDMLKPMSREFIIPSEGKTQLWLTGHDFPHYSTTMKVTIATIMNDNTRSQQIISFLPLFEQTPAELINLSMQRFRAGNFQGCIQAAEDALRLRPDYAPAYNNICAALNELGEWDKAVAAGERAVALDPGSALAKNNLAWARRREEARR